MNYSNLFAAALIASASLVPLPARAENVVADAQLIARTLQDAGYKAQVKADATGDPMITSASGGYSYTIFFYGCTDNRSCKTVQFYAGFDTRNVPDLAQMNEYSRTKRWGRVYVDKAGDAAIEFDLDLEDGGVSKELFLDNVEYWASAMDGFAEWAFDNFGESN